MPLQIITPRTMKRASIALARGMQISAPYHGTPFTPSALSGLQLWLAADSSTKWQDSARTTPATADTDPVGAWDDLSGNSNNVLQATAGKRPLLKLNIQNGKPVLRFDGIDDLLALASAATLNAMPTLSVVVVFTAAAPTAASQVVVCKSDAISTGWNVYVHASTSGDIVWRGSFGNNDNVLAPNTALRVFSATHVSGAQSGWINGLSKSTGVNATNPISATLPLGIGALSTALPLNGDIAELIIYNRALTSPERQLVERYLGSKWGVTVA